MKRISITIRPLNNYLEYVACEKMQTDVFEYAPLEVIPYQLLQSFALSGGIVIGAFDDESLVGAVIGYVGLLSDGTPYHRSQRMMVLPQYRNKGIGEMLKRAQAADARAKGLHLMCWTFDPLRTLNAHLNLHKLAVTSRRYIPDAYASTSSLRDAGLPIDRLWVEWDLAADTSAQNDDITDDRREVVLHNLNDEPGNPVANSEAATIVIQIPASIDEWRASRTELAGKWRATTRLSFTHYFALGYRAVDYIYGEGYLLRRRGRTAPAAK